MGVTEFDSHVEHGVGFLEVGFRALDLVFLDSFGEVPLQVGDEKNSCDDEHAKRGGDGEAGAVDLVVGGPGEEPGGGLALEGF